MKTTKKLNNCYSINLDDDTAALLEKVAEHHQRKPRELLRLLIVPSLLKEWAKIQQQEHPENQQAPTVAIFRN